VISYGAIRIAGFETFQKQVLIKVSPQREGSPWSNTVISR